MRRSVPGADEYLDVSLPVLDHGFVRLVDYMGSDEAVAEAARVSLSGEGVRATSDDEKLLRHLMRSGHTSPFEMAEMKFHCAMPIFVARQWVRHRTASINEMSGRYGQLPEVTYVPGETRVSWQSPVDKQGSGATVPPELARRVQEEFRAENSDAFALYDELLGKVSHGTFTQAEQDLVAANGGVSRELARINLPLSTYTQWYWKSDLHNLLHFLELRLDEHAQWELRQYAQVIAKVVRAIFPVTWEAFEDYRLHAVKLTGPELELLRSLLAGVRFTVGAASLEVRDDGYVGCLTPREMGEFRDKLVKMGLTQD